MGGKSGFLTIVRDSSIMNVPMKSPFRYWAAGCLLAAAALSAPGCGRKAVPRNVILVTLDTLRADHVSAISPGRADTPNLDFLAGRGTLYKNCFSLIPITLPSHASIFYSQPPHLLKNYTNGHVLHDLKDPPPLAGLFEKKGFQTAAFVSLGVVRAVFGLNQGFGEYLDDFPPDRWYLSAEEINRRVFPWLETHKNRPFFLWVHYSDPHEPYAPPDTPEDTEIFVNGVRIGSYCLNKYAINTAELPLKSGLNEIRFVIRNDSNESLFQARLDYLEIKKPDEMDLKINNDSHWYHRKEDDVHFLNRTASIFIANPGGPADAVMRFRGRLNLPVETTTRQNYRREVEYMDAEIGKLWAKLEDLGLFDKTAILAVGDHGEGLGEYRTEMGDPYVGHIHFLQDVYMKVPLIVYDPASHEPPAAREEDVTLLDVAPTIAALMGWKIPAGYLGRNLAGQPPGGRPEIFEETYKPEAVRDKFALRSYPWHLIFTPEKQQVEIFDLRKDPNEFDDFPESAALPPEVAELKKKLEAKTRDILRTKIEVKMDKKDEEMLRSLGYVNKK